jgi:copper oxidase (laccase) domain-containing protein
MKKITKNDVEYLIFNSFEEYDFIEHGFSTKIGGVSEGYYSSMNLRLECDDASENIKRNFEIFLEAFDLSKENTVLTNQVHGKKIIKINVWLLML